MDFIFEILAEILGEIFDILLAPTSRYDATNEARLGCALVLGYFVMMGVAIGMGVWVLPVNKPAGIALIIVGALLFIGSLIGFIKILFGRKK